MCVCVGVCVRARVCVCVRACMSACTGGVRFSNSTRIIPRDYRILLLLKMPIPSMHYTVPIFTMDVICINTATYLKVTIFFLFNYQFFQLKVLH